MTLNAPSSAGHLINIQAISNPSGIDKNKYCNEDAIGYGEQFLFVLDGATGLTSDLPVMASDSDAAWFARETAQWLETHLLSSFERSISELLQQGMRELLSRWKGELQQLPSAGIAVFRLCKNYKNQDHAYLEYFGLGDCLASIERTDGSFYIWKEQALESLDAEAIRQALCYREKYHCSMYESLIAIQDVLRRHRDLRNQPDGYWILDPSGIGISHARYAKIPVQQCRSLFLCTDGFAQLIGFGVASDLPELHQKIAQGEETIQSLSKQLFALQSEDCELLRLPRFKLRDDTSAIFAEIAFP